MVLNMAALIFLILILQALTGKHIIFIRMLCLCDPSRSLEFSDWLFAMNTVQSRAGAYLC